MAIKMKRGTTESWALGPEMVHWEDLKVQGKDSLIHCEGTNLQMNVYTASANYFYDENGQLENVKRPGLWLIQPGEIGWDASAQVEFKCQTDGPSDCWLEVAAPNAPSVHGQKIPLGQQAQMTVPYIGEWGLYIRWPDKGTVEIATIKISIRESQAYEELEEGQLGLEYAGDGNVKIKAGIPGVSKWDELPYIGAYTDLVPDYGTNLLPFNNISSHRQGNNDFIIEHKEGVFVFHGQVQPNKKEYLIFPVAPGPKSNLILKAGKTYCLKTHEEAPEDQFYLAFQSIWFSDGNYIDNDVIREYTPSVDTEVASISFSVHGSSLGTNYDNYQLALYLGEKENTPTFGRVNKALFPQKQSYTPEQQAQIRQNVQAAATQYIIELYSDGDTYYISETWSELEYLISLGLSFMLRYDGMLCYPDWEPSVEDAAFSFSTGDCGASTAIFLWKNSTGGMSVDYYVYGDLIRIGEQIWFGGGEEADFTDTVNSMITAQTENISTTLNSIGPDIQWAKQAIQNNKYEFYVIENGSPTTFTMYNLVTWRQFLRNYKGLMSNTEHFDQNSQGQITYKGIDLVYGSPLAHSSYTQGNEVWLDETILPYHGYAV